MGEARLRLHLGRLARDPRRAVPRKRPEPRTVQRRCTLTRRSPGWAVPNCLRQPEQDGGLPDGQPVEHHGLQHLPEFRYQAPQRVTDVPADGHRERFLLGVRHVGESGGRRRLGMVSPAPEGCRRGGAPRSSTAVRRPSRALGPPQTHAPHARYVSCMTSATICSSAQRRRSRTAIHGAVRRYSSSNAARSPVAASWRRRSSSSSPSAFGAFLTDLAPACRPARAAGFPSYMIPVT